MVEKSTTYLACRRTNQKGKAGKTERKKMRESSEGMTVLICENLGRPALLLKTTDAPILLLDAGLTCEDRIKIMNRLIDPGAA